MGSNEMRRSVCLRGFQRQWGVGGGVGVATSICAIDQFAFPEKRSAFEASRRLSADSFRNQPKLTELLFIYLLLIICVVRVYELH